MTDDPASSCGRGEARQRRAAGADEAMGTRGAPDPRPFLATCETCGARRPWPTRAEAVADAGRHQQAHLGHRARAPHPVLNAELLVPLAVLIIVLALLVLLFVPRPTPLRFLTSG
jgi:hypothetical protein